MNNKVKHVLVLLFVVSTLLLMIGSVSAYTDDLNGNIEASNELDGELLSIDDDSISNDVSNQLTISNIEETDDALQSVDNDLNNSENVVSNSHETTINSEDSGDKLSDPSYMFTVTVNNRTVLTGQEVEFTYFVKYQGPGQLHDEYITVDVFFENDEMTYTGFVPNPNAEAPWLGPEWWGNQAYTVINNSATNPTGGWENITVKYKPPVPFEPDYCFNFTVKFKTNHKGEMGTGANLHGTYYWAVDQTDAIEKLNITAQARDYQVRIGDDVYIDVCVENNKLRSYFGDYRRILLIEDFFPSDGLSYIDYSVNPDKYGNLPDLSKIRVHEEEPGFVQIEYDTSDGWLPNAILNVTLHLKAKKNGIDCSHFRTWWYAPDVGVEEFWALASVCVGEPDLNLTKTVQEEEVGLNDDVYFDIYCVNSGEIPFLDHDKYTNWLIIEDYYPNGLEYVDYKVNPDENGTIPEGVQVDKKEGNHLTIAYNIGGEWPVGSSLNVTLHFKAREIGTFTNNATVIWKWKDWGPEDEHITIVKKDNDTVKVGNIKFDIEKISNYKNVEVGDLVVFTIIYKNIGYRDLTGVYIKDNDYTQGIEYYDYSDKSLWTYDGVDTWYYNDILPRGESVTLELTFKATTSGFKNNTCIAGHNITNDTLNSTDNVTVLEKETEEDDVKPDEDPEPEPISPEEPVEPEPPVEPPVEPEPPKETATKTVDPKATGNPLCVLLLSLLALCFVPIRGKE